jgi:hypothetical protein
MIMENLRSLELKMREVSPEEASRLLKLVAQDMITTRSSTGKIIENGVEVVVWLWDYNGPWEDIEPASGAL